MKKVLSFVLAGAMVAFAGNLKAQNASEGGLFEHIGIGINGGTTGAGIGAHISLLPVLKVRVGVNYIGATVHLNTQFKGDSYDGSQAEVVDGQINDVKISFFNGSLLFDYYPFGGNSIFSITAGAYFGANRFVVDGVANDFSYGLAANRLQIKANGKFDGYAQLGGVVKPYIGIGLGKTIPNSRIGFRWDLGVSYSGKTVFHSDYVKGGDFTLEKSDFNGAGGTANMLLTAIEILRWYPNCSFTLSYRIF